MDAAYETYSYMSAEELDTEIAMLNEALQNLNSSQNHGTVAWTRNRDGLFEQRRMAMRVRNEKAGLPPVQNHALVDCSDVGSYNTVGPRYGYREANP